MVTSPVEIKPPLVTRNYLLAFTGNFLMFFSFYLLLPILPFYLIEMFQADKTVMGIILASYTLTALAVRPFAGFLVDFYQRKPLLLCAYTLFIGFFVGYLLASTLLLFALIRAMHGFAFGLVSTSQSTVAIDVMHPERRNEGIGYYGLSSNIAVAISPMVSMYLFDTFHRYDLIFGMAFVIGVLGLCCVSSLTLKRRERIKNQPLSLDRFFLSVGIPEFLTMLPLSFGYGLVSTYVAIYAKQELNIESGIGTFFFLLAAGMMSSRLMTARLLKRGKLVETVTMGIGIVIVGFLLFVFWKKPIGLDVAAAVLGMGYGFTAPSVQAMFVNMATHHQRGTANSTYFTSFDLGLGVGVMLGGKIAEQFSFTTAYQLAIGLIVCSLIYFHFVASNHFLRHKLPPA